MDDSWLARVNFLPHLCWLHFSVPFIGLERLDFLVSAYAYGIIAWGNTYSSTLKPLYVLQKKALRLMTFSKFDEHSSPLFKTLIIIKLRDLVLYQIVLCS